jgi:hypothetical protein
MLVSVKAFHNLEQHLIVAATTTDGVILEENDPEKLLRLPAKEESAGLSSHADDATLMADVEARTAQLLREVKQRNLGCFEQEVQKLDVWADDLKLGLEQEIKEVDREIKKVRRTAATSLTLEEKFSWQEKQRELEASAVNCDANCLNGRMKLKRSATASSTSWKHSFSSRWRNGRCLRLNGRCDDEGNLCCLYENAHAIHGATMGMNDERSDLCIWQAKIEARFNCVKIFPGAKNEI